MRLAFRLNLKILKFDGNTFSVKSQNAAMIFCHLTRFFGIFAKKLIFLSNQREKSIEQ